MKKTMEYVLHLQNGPQPYANSCMIHFLKKKELMERIMDIMKWANAEKGTYLDYKKFKPLEQPEAAKPVFFWVEERTKIEKHFEEEEFWKEFVTWASESEQNVNQVRIE